MYQEQCILRGSISLNDACRSSFVASPSPRRNTRLQPTSPLPSRDLQDLALRHVLAGAHPPPKRPPHSTIRYPQAKDIGTKCTRAQLSTQSDPIQSIQPNPMHSNPTRPLQYNTTQPHPIQADPVRSNPVCSIRKLNVSKLRPPKQLSPTRNIERSSY